MFRRRLEFLSLSLVAVTVLAASSFADSVVGKPTAGIIRNATTPGTEDGTECIYGTTEETRNDYGTAGTVSTTFAETPKEWNGYRASAKKYPALENTTFVPVELGGGTQAFVLHEALAQADEPDVYHLYVYTPLHNVFSIDFLSGVTLETEEGLAKEVARKLDAEWRTSE